MDKRFLSALLLCFVIVVGWTLLFPPPKKPVESQPAPSAAQTDAAAPGATRDDAAQPATEAKGRVVREDAERVETYIVGDAGARWLLKATNRGATLVEARREGHAEKSGTSAEDAAKPENWALLLSTVRTGGEPSRALAWRALPSAKTLAGDGFDSALWAMRPVGDASAPKGVEWEYAPGTGVVFVKRLVADAGAKRLRLELELRNEASNEAGRRDFVLVPAAGLRPDSGDSFYKEPQAVAWSPSGDDADGELATESTHEKGDVAALSLIHI